MKFTERNFRLQYLFAYAFDGIFDLVFLTKGHTIESQVDLIFYYIIIVFFFFVKTRVGLRGKIVLKNETRFECYT